MLHKRSLLVAATPVILTVGWLADAHPVLGCVCSGRTVEEYTAEADVVFAATVTEHIDSLGYPYQEDVPPVYRLSVDSVWKGSRRSPLDTPQLAVGRKAAARRADIMGSWPLERVHMRSTS